MPMSVKNRGPARSRSRNPDGVKLSSAKPAVRTADLSAKTKTPSLLHCLTKNAVTFRVQSKWTTPRRRAFPVRSTIRRRGFVSARVRNRMPPVPRRGCRIPAMWQVSFLRDLPGRIFTKHAPRRWTPRKQQESHQTRRMGKPGVERRLNLWRTGPHVANAVRQVADRLSARLTAAL
jgi:hypothetical protein